MKTRVEITREKKLEPIIDFHQIFEEKGIYKRVDVNACEGEYVVNFSPGSAPMLIRFYTSSGQITGVNLDGWRGTKFIKTDFNLKIVLE